MSEAGGAAAPERPPATSGAAGVLACLPLLLAYEWAVAAEPDGARNLAELLVAAPLGPLAERFPGWRPLLVAALTVSAIVTLRRRGQPILPPPARAIAEGVLWGVALGPAAVALQRGLAGVLPELPLPGGPAAGVPRLERVLFATGGAAWEELVFRLGALSLLYLLARHAASFLGAARRPAGWIADAVAAVGSSALFAAAHLDAVAAHLGWVGEPWDPARFLWRFAAGLLLAALFRWRGLGPAAWAHAGLNAALLLGASPGVLQ